MKDLLRAFFRVFGVLPQIQVFREKHFPSAFHLLRKENDLVYTKFYSQFIKKDDLCFDIGAHQGHRTGIFLILGARVVAVEPQKKLFRYLKAKYKNTAKLENIGIGSFVGNMTMYICQETTLSTFSKDWIDNTKNRFSQYKWDRTQMANISTLDKLIEKYGIPDFCKIDVEGFEYEVLKGLSHNIPCLSIEFMTPENNDKICKCLEHLSKINPTILINYSITDTLEFSLPEWLSYSETIEVFNNTIFKEVSWGDIYIKMSLP